MTSPRAASVTATRRRTLEEHQPQRVDEEPQPTIRSLLGPVITVLLSAIAAAQALRLWEWRPGTPLGFSGDAPWMATLVRGYLDYGPYADNPLFGAPFALNTGWSSTGNDLHVWLLSALGLLSHDPFNVLALYFFITFPASALSMYWLCRRYAVARPAAVMAGVLFSVIPGHQERFPHLFLAAYWAVPFAAWLIIETGCGRSVFRGGAELHGARRLMHYGARVLMLVSMGLGDVYYVAFTLVIAVPILLLRQVRHFDRRELVRLTVPLAVMVVPTLVSIAAARRRADSDQITGAMPFGRTFLDSNRWAGQIIDLVLPWPGHRVSTLGQRTRLYDALTGTPGEISAIGAVAVIGLVALLLVTGAALLRGRVTSLNPLVAALTVASLIAIAFFTRGGLGALTAFLVTPQVRTWSRLFLFIGLFGLLAIAWFVTRLRTRPGGRRHVVAASALLLVLGVLDQTSPGRAPAYAANRAELTTLSDFDAHTEERLGSGCSLFVLPVVGFPEVNDPLWSDLMSLGLASRNLRWSFGAIKGTAAADWQLGLPTADPQRFMDDVAALGFCGVVVEKSLGQRLPQLAAQLPVLLGEPVAISADERYTSYSLRDVRRSLETREGSAGLQARARAALHPVVATLNGAWAVDEVAGRRYPLGPGPAISLYNMGDKPATVTVELTVLGAVDEDARVQFQGLDANAAPVALAPHQRRRISVTVTVPLGASSVGVVLSGAAQEGADYSHPGQLVSVESLTATPANPSVNVGVDLPTP